MGAVRDDRQGTGKCRSQCRDISRETGIVDGDQGLRARRHRPRGGCGVETAVVADVGKDRRRTEAQDRIRGGDKSQRRGHHFVAGSDPEGADGEVEGDAAVGDRNRVTGVTACSEGVLEGGDSITSGERPRSKRCHDRGDVALIHPVPAIRERLCPHRDASGDGRQVCGIHPPMSAGALAGHFARRSRRSFTSSHSVLLSLL